MRRVVTILIAFAAVMLLAPGPPAGAAITGPCTASINGVNVGPLGDTKASDAIRVQKDATVTVTGTAPAAGTVAIKMQVLGLVSWNAGKHAYNGTTWQSSVAISDYARFGAGLYRVSATTTAGACSGSALIRVEGSPFATVGGIASTGLAALALFGAALGSLSSARRGRRLSTSGFALGAVAGLGIAALMQQLSLLYPTAIISTATIAAGSLLFGAGIPAIASPGAAGGIPSAYEPPRAATG